MDERLGEVDFWSNTAPYASLLSIASKSDGGMSSTKIKAAIESAVVQGRSTESRCLPRSSTAASGRKICKAPAQLLDHFENKQHIDGGFLYYDDAAQGYRRCVHSGRSPVRTARDDSKACSRIMTASRTAK